LLVTPAHLEGRGLLPALAYHPDLHVLGIGEMDLVRQQL
jgi:hypothetical protein